MPHGRADSTREANRRNAQPSAGGRARRYSVTALRVTSPIEQLSEIARLFIAIYCSRGRATENCLVICIAGGRPRFLTTSVIRTHSKTASPKSCDLAAYICAHAARKAAARSPACTRIPSAGCRPPRRCGIRKCTSWRSRLRHRASNLRSHNAACSAQYALPGARLLLQK